MVIRLRENTTSSVVAKYGSVHDEDLAFEDLLERLESPSARFLEATALFLVELARLGHIPLPGNFESPDASRRIGFIAEHLSVHSELSNSVRRHLKLFADEVYAELEPTSFEDLGFSRRTSPARIRRLKRHADEIDRRWKVWGEVELRMEFLQ